MPQWQKQLLSNSFGHVRRDEGISESEKKAAKLLDRKQKLAKELSRRRRSSDSRREEDRNKPEGES